MGDKFQNLPILLLKQINRNLDDNLDKLCFSLACKRFYNDRDKYLEVKIEKQRNTIDEKQSDFKSYRNIINNSFENKNKVFLVSDSLCYGSSKKRSPLDLYFDTEEDDISTLKLTDDITEIDYRSEYPGPWKDSKLFFELLAKSNVSSFSIMGEANFDLSELPPNIKKLDSLNANIKIEKGSLPDYLEELIVEAVDQEIEKDVLPKSLLSLSINEYDFEFKQGVLPPNLQCLDVQLQGLNNNPQNKSPTPKVFPQSLRKVTVPFEWLNQFHSIPALKEILILTNDSDELNLNFNDIPASIEHFNLTIPGVNVSGKLSPQIKYLRLNQSPYTVPIEFSQNTDYEKLAVYIPEVKVGSLPPKLKKLSLLEECKSIEVGALPNTLKSLSIHNPPEDFSGFPEHSIPNSVERLVLRHHRVKRDYGKGFEEFLKRLPTSIRELKSEFKFFGDLPMSAFPVNIKTFIIRSEITDYHIRRLDDNASGGNFIVLTPDLYGSPELGGGFYVKSQDFFERLRQLEKEIMDMEDELEDELEDEYGNVELGRSPSMGKASLTKKYATILPPNNFKEIMDMEDELEDEYGNVDFRRSASMGKASLTKKYATILPPNNFKEIIDMEDELEDEYGNVEFRRSPSMGKASLAKKYATILPPNNFKEIIDMEDELEDEYGNVDFRRSASMGKASLAKKYAATLPPNNFKEIIDMEDELEDEDEAIHFN